METNLRHAPVGAVTADPAVTLVWRAPRGAALRRAAEPVLTALAALGVACVVAAATMSALGLTPLVVRSGSMEPAIPVGSMVLVRAVDVDEVSPGDVVSVVRRDGTRVTHRVAEVAEAAGPLRRLTLRGDANPVPDPESVLTGTVDRAVLTLPALGRVLEGLSWPPLHFGAGVATGGALWWAFGPPTVRNRGRWVTRPVVVDEEEVTA